VCTVFPRTNKSTRDRRRQGEQSLSLLEERYPMVFTLPLLAAIIALIFGILILIVPRLLNYIVAIYLIIIGIIGILAAFT
jgi:hypothetical protein